MEDESDTTGEKPFEEFYMETENVNLTRYSEIGIIKFQMDDSKERIQQFNSEIQNLREMKFWNKKQILRAIKKMLPELNHAETGRYLDDKM